MTQKKMTVADLARFLPIAARFARNERTDLPHGVWWFAERPYSDITTTDGNWLSGIILDADGVVEIRPKPRWRAAHGEQYWFIDDEGVVMPTTERGYAKDDGHHTCGNYWRTEVKGLACDDAQKALRMKIHAGEEE